MGLFLLSETVLLWVYNEENDRTRATILFAATIVAGAFALYSYLHRIQEHRFSEAGRMMQRWNAPDRVAIRTVMAHITEGNFDICRIERKTQGHVFEDDDHKLRIQVLSALNFYEELAIGIFEKSIDNERSRRFFYSISNQTYDALESWIRNERKVDRTQSYYMEFENLIRRWRQQQNSRG